MADDIIKEAEDQSDEVLDLIRDIAKKSADGDYIYRGEPKCRRKVSSGLYRKYSENGAENLVNKILQKAIEAVQDKMLDAVSRFTSQDDNDEILAELQHYGGKTNLIDFTTDCLVALFFACDGAFSEDGRVVLLPKNLDDENIHIWRPRNPSNRVLAQKSIFVQPKRGFVEVEPDKEILIPKKLKESVLKYLRRHHGIYTESIYNDLHGFIKHQEIHHNAYVELTQGTIYFRQGKYEKAIKHYNEAITLMPNFDWAYLNRGTAYRVLGNLDRAIQDYSKAIEINPDFAEAYYNLGGAYMGRGNKGDLDRAIRDYSKAIALIPDYAEAYNNRGIAYRIRGEQGDLDRAIQDHSKTIELKPNWAETYHNRGVACTKRGYEGDFDCAIRDLTKAIELKLNHVEIYFYRGVAYMGRGHEGDLDRAIQDFSKAIEMKPDYAEAYYNRGVAYAGKDALDRAIQDYDKAIAVNPDFTDAYYNRGIAYDRIGKDAPALRDFTKAIKLKPDDYLPWVRRSWIRLRRQEWDKARKDLQGAKEKGADIALLFSKQFGSVPDFERKYRVRLPDDIREMLTPDTD